jgi:hypothetical protein
LPPSHHPLIPLTGVDGVDVVIGTSSFLREFSHGKDMAYITKTAIEVITFVKSKGIEVRFSSEDSFRSDLVDLLSIYQTVDKIGVNRVGIADTVGCANPRQVYELVRTLRGVVGCDIEIHLHNDTGMGMSSPSLFDPSVVHVSKLLPMHTPPSKQAQHTSIHVRPCGSSSPFIHVLQPSSELANALASPLSAVSLRVSTLPTPSTSSPSITSPCFVKSRTLSPRL